MQGEVRWGSNLEASTVNDQHKAVVVRRKSEQTESTTDPSKDNVHQNVLELGVKQEATDIEVQHQKKLLAKTLYEINTLKSQLESLNTEVHVLKTQRPRAQSRNNM